jgi:plastocyanin
MHHLVVVLAVASVACGGGGYNAPTAPAGTTNPGGTGGTGGGGGTASNSVQVIDNEFNPSSITVPVGTTVTWTFNGAYSAHNVTFATGSVSSGDKTSGTYTRTFNVAGSYPYNCTIHGAAMSGTVVVQ